MFYVVLRDPEWKPRDWKNVVTVTYEDVEAAKAEASRLSAETGGAYYVLQALGVMRPPAPDPPVWESLE